MKKLLGLIVCVFVLISCKDDLQNAGQVILDDKDAIVVCADTFTLHSNLRDCKSIISNPDSFLVGELENKYGTLRAEIFTQLACPTGFTYPENAVFDSVCLHLYYRTWTGDGKSPLALNVYQIDLQNLHPNTDTSRYQSDMIAEEYCSFADSTCIVKNQRIVWAKAYKDSVYSSSTQKYTPCITFRLSDDFCKRFTSLRTYPSQEDFNQFFKGLYIGSNFGSATILNIVDINMGVYYHFSYPKYGAKTDTIVNDMKAFYANAEVQKVNRFDYLNKEHTIQLLNEENDSVNYIISPAGIYTSLALPMKQMDSTIKTRINEQWAPKSLKRPYVNLAQIRIDVMNGSNTGNSSDWSKPASQMLLIKDNRVESFFTNKELPNDTVAILSPLTAGVDSLGKACLYYSFDLSDMLTAQLRSTQTTDDTLHMTLVPVSVETTTTNNTTVVIGVKQSQIISATKVRSANNPLAPMTLKVVYSGF